MRTKRFISTVMALVIMLSVVFCAVPTVGAKSTSSKKATLSLSDKFIALYTKGCENTIVAYGSLVNKSLNEAAYVGGKKHWTDVIKMKPLKKF